MARLSPVRMFIMTQGEGRIVKCRIRHNFCSFCFKPIEFNSEMVWFQTQSKAHHCHVECEVDLRNKIEREYWDDWESEKKEKLEVEKLMIEVKKNSKNKVKARL